MYVRKLRLENIRPFEALEFDFDRPGPDSEVPGLAPAHEYAGWNVIAGDNASGKSTVLKALTLGLVGPALARTLEPSLSGWIRTGADRASIEVVVAHGPEDTFRGGGRRPTKPITLQLELNRRGSTVELEAARSSLKAPATGPWAEEQGAWFSASYGPFRRLYGASAHATRLMAMPGKVPRYASLFREDATLAEGTAWLQSLKFKALESRAEETSLLDDVLRLLRDDFLRRGFSLEDVDSDDLWLKDQDGLRLGLAEMSDGYRAALALLIDILRHMVAVYGGAGLIQSGEGRRLHVPHSGVVIIDEVDAHLHPEWQRTLGFWLKERFPNVQFITTSHSPFVVQATDPGGLYRLPSPGEDATPTRVPEADRLRSVQGTPDEILRGAPFEMEVTRSPKMEATREEHAKLAARSRAGVATEREKEHMRLLRVIAGLRIEDEG